MIKLKKCKKCGWDLLPTDIECPHCISEALVNDISKGM